MSLLEDLVSGDGLSSLHSIIWIGLGVWALIGTLFYIPKPTDRQFVANMTLYSLIETGLDERRNSLFNTFIPSLSSISRYDDGKFPIGS